MKKIRLTALTMAGLMAAASMTGCGAKTAETTAASETTTAAGTMAAETTTVAETAGKVSQTKPLVVYLNDFDDIIPEMFKKATGYDVDGGRQPTVGYRMAGFHAKYQLSRKEGNASHGLGTI